MYINQRQLTSKLGSFEGTFGQQTAQQLLAEQQAAEQQAAAGQQTAAGAATGSVIAGVGQILGAVGTIGAQFYAAHTQAQLEKQRLKYQQNAPAAPSIDPALLAALSQPQKSNTTLILVAVLAVVGIGIVGFMLMGSSGEDYGPEPGYGPEPAGGSPPPQIRRVRRVKKLKKP